MTGFTAAERLDSAAAFDMTPTTRSPEPAGRMARRGPRRFRDDRLHRPAASARTTATTSSRASIASNGDPGRRILGASDAEACHDGWRCSTRSSTATTRRTSFSSATSGTTTRTTTTTRLGRDDSVRRSTSPGAALGTTLVPEDDPSVLDAEERGRLRPGRRTGAAAVRGSKTDEHLVFPCVSRWLIRRRTAAPRSSAPHRRALPACSRRSGRSGRRGRRARAAFSLSFAVERGAPGARRHRAQTRPSRRRSRSGRGAASRVAAAFIG